MIVLTGSPECKGKSYKRTLVIAEEWKSRAKHSVQTLVNDTQAIFVEHRVHSDPCNDDRNEKWLDWKNPPVQEKGAAAFGILVFALEGPSVLARPA